MVDGRNILINIYGVDPQKVTVVDYVMTSPMGFYSGMIITGTMLLIILFNDLFDMILNFFKKGNP